MLVAGTLAGPGHREVATDKVDLIEVNFYYDEKGQPVLQQLIFFDWSEADQRYEVRSFRIIHELHQLPRRMHKNGLYVVIWQDQMDNVLRKVYAKSIRQTRTQYDPEMVHRKLLPKEQRRGLSRPLNRRRTK